MKTTSFASEKILFFFIVALLLPAALFAQWGPRIKLSTHAISAGLNENMGPWCRSEKDTS